MHTTNRLFRLLEGCAVSLTLWVAANAARAQPPPPTSGERLHVADVVVQGSQLISPPTVLSYVKTRRGSDYNPDIVQEDVRTLVASKLFAEVRVQVENLSQERVKVYFLLRDWPNTIRRIEYRGAKHLKDDELNVLTGLRLDAPLSPTANQVACQKIIREYNRLGRPFADCSLIQGDKASDTEVIFQITEGPKVQISDLQFTGNTFVSGAVLATHITSSQKVLGAFGGDLNPELLEADLGQLQEYYRTFGYHDVSISYEVQYQPDGLNAVVVFHIIEGIRYRLKDNPQVVGSKRTPNPEALAQTVQLKALDWYDGQKLKRGAAELRDWYGYQGFDVHVQVVPYFSKEQPGVVTVRYEVVDEHKAVGSRQ